MPPNRNGNIPKMRTLSAALLVTTLILARAHAAPTAQEQGLYNNAAQALVDAINAYRANLGRAALVPLVELCTAARQEAEFDALEVGSAISIFDRATGLGYTGQALSALEAFSSPETPPELLADLLSNPSYAAFISDNAAAAVGVGIVQITDEDIKKYFEENQDALVCVDAFNLCMNGNNIDDHLRHGIVIENTYGSVVSGNMIEECNGTAIILRRDAYGITLSANVIAHHLEGGIDLDDAWGCSISANTFVLVHKFGIRVNRGGRHAITGNTFGNSYIGEDAVKRVPKSDDPMQLDAQGGVILQGAESITLTGNSFSGTDAEALSISDDSRQILFSSNTLTDCARKAPAGTPWIKHSAAKHVLIKDNLGLPTE